MYRVLFTSDYEIHGCGAGSPRRLILEPTWRMLEQLERYGARLTIMADAAELAKFKAHAEQTGRDRFDWGPIAQQLRQAVSRGHDVQLHLHSSYVDATWDEAAQRWQQRYEEYDLARLPYARVRSMIRSGKRLLVETCSAAKPSYDCFVFRAANWSMQPSPAVVRALIDEGFRIDSSVWKYGRSEGLVAFDYTAAPSDLVPWPVHGDDVCRRDPAGRLFEFPIYTEQRWLGSFVTPNRVYRVAAQLANPLPRAEPSGAKGARAAVRRGLRALVRRHAWKADFNQCTGAQLIEALERAEARYGHPATPLPFVLIGHSKTFTPLNERSLRPLLEFVAEHPDRFSFGTFADFDLEQVRACA